MLSIEQQIAETNVDEILSLFPTAPYKPYSYQAAVYRLIADQIRKYSHPFVVKASVSAGKTTIISMVASRLQQLRMPAMVISRQGEIVEQDAAEMWSFGVQNSIFCAGLGMKAIAFPIVVGSEKSVANALFTDFIDYAPLALIVDECHHIDVDDLLASELTIVKKQVAVYDANGEQMFDHNGDPVTEEVEYQGETYADMVEAKRSKYTILIRELQARCLRVHRKRLRIIGLTGTDYRGTQPIINEDLSTPGFWRKAICDISTDYLVKFGAVVPTHFGDSNGLHYDLAEFKSDGGEGASDFSSDKMRAMQKRILDQGTMTQKIMLDVYERTKDRLSVLVTCAGKKHCEEAAAALPPGTTYCIITDSVGEKQRRELLKEVAAGKIKFTFQIGCLTTGVNIPIWDTGVILRKIGSLTLLTQLIGRTMRKPKQWMIDAGLIKKDALILDYSETMLEMGELYFNPILEQYQFEMAEASQDWQTCPVCEKMGKHGRNSPHARRCIAEHVVDPKPTQPVGKGYAVRRFASTRIQFTTQRCEYFWKSRPCVDVVDNTGRMIKTGCGIENDIAARFCRGCGGTLIDPNERLSNKHYTESDFYDVIHFRVRPTKNQTSILLEYMLQDPADGRSFRAVEMLSPQSDHQIARKTFRSTIAEHVQNAELARKIGGIRNALAVLEFAQHIRAPLKVTHRKGKSNKDIIHKKIFEGDK